MVPLVPLGVLSTIVGRKLSFQTSPHVCVSSCFFSFSVVLNPLYFFVENNYSRGGDVISYTSKF